MSTTTKVALAICNAMLGALIALIAPAHAHPPLSLHLGDAPTGMSDVDCQRWQGFWHSSREYVNLRETAASDLSISDLERLTSSGFSQFDTNTLRGARDHAWEHMSLCQNHKAKQEREAEARIDALKTKRDAQKLIDDAKREHDEAIATKAKAIEEIEWRASNAVEAALQDELESSSKFASISSVISNFMMFAVLISFIAIETITLKGWRKRGVVKTAVRAIIVMPFVHFIAFMVATLAWIMIETSANTEKERIKNAIIDVQRENLQTRAEEQPTDE